jgi:hypothetical protein
MSALTIRLIFISYNSYNISESYQQQLPLEYFHMYEVILIDLKRSLVEFFFFFLVFFSVSASWKALVLKVRQKPANQSVCFISQA